MVNATATTDPLIGRTLGEFILRSKIGEGGFGSVYRADQPTLNRPAVVKVLQRSLRSRVDLVQRFLREAQLASRLDHPYAAHIYAFGAESDGVLWIAMELVRGIPLNNLLRLQGAMPLSRFAPLIERICEVVHAAHDQGIVHRDLKPANVMVMSRVGRLLPKLLDFGIAKLVLDTDGDPAAERADQTLAQKAADAHRAQPEDFSRDDTVLDTTPVAPDLTRSMVTTAEGSPVKHTPTAARERSTRDLTATGEAMGSPPYMAPEQWEEDGQIDARTDIYALGVLSYQCLTRRLPFVEDSTRAIALAHATKPMPPMGGNFPPAIEAVLRKALAKAKEERFQTAIELGEALREAAGLSSERSAMPELPEEARQTAMQDAPQPLAEAVGALSAAHNAHQARDSMWLVLHVAIRLVGLLSLGCRTRVGSGEATDSDLVGELLRQLRRRGLDDIEWVSLVRELCRPFAKRRDAYPVPELVGLFYDDDGQELDAQTGDAFRPLLDLRDQGVTGGSEAQIHVLLERGLPLVAKFLGMLSFLSAYQLVVPRGGRAERWMGVRMPRRSTMVCRGELEDGHPLLVDADGAIILSLYPLLQVAQPTPGAPEELFLLEGQGRQGTGAARLVALPAGFERQEEAFWELSRSVMISADDQSASPLDERAPYRGLSTFRPEDAAVFFGREREAEALVNRLRMQGMVAVVGPSGAGKSSFVQAGVIPNLPVGWRTLTVRPGSQPLTALRARLAKESIVLPTGSDVPAMADAVRQRAAQSEGVLLLIIDQFEELFTLCGDADERKTYAELVANLGRASEDPLRVVVTLRDDFLIRADEMVALRERLALGLQLVTTPAAEDLLRIVIEPARRSGYGFDEAKLPWEMVQAVVGQPGALPLLSFTASKLWELRDRSARLLPKKAYEAMGGVGGALAQHAEQTLESMSSPEQKLVHEAFRRLVTAEGTRAILSRGELLEVLGDRRAGEAMLEKLINARLLSASEGIAATEATADAAATPGSTDQIEVVHEALLGAWPRLVRWRSEDAEGARLRDQLRQAAQQWAARGKPRGLLWRDEALTEYQLWKQRFPARSTAVEEEFGQASVAYAIAGRRIRRALLLTAFAALSIFIVFLLRANKRVNEQRAVAAQKAQEAKDALAQSNEEQGRQYLLQDKPLEALAFLKEAFDNGRQGPGIRFMLGRIFQLLDAQKLIIQEDPTRRLVFDVSPDAVLATSSINDHVDLFAAKDGRPIGKLTVDDAVNRVSFSPDGKRLLVQTLTSVSVWDVAAQRRAMESKKMPELWSAVWTDDGKQILTQSKNDGAAIDPQTGVVLESWPGVGLPSGSRSVVAAQEGQHVVVHGAGSGLQADSPAAPYLTAVQRATRRVAIADSANVRCVRDKLLWTLPYTAQTVIHALEFGPGSSPLLVVVTEQGAATLFNTDTHQSVLELASEGALLARFTPDAAYLLVGFGDGRILLFNTDHLQLVGEYYGRHEKIYDVVAVGDSVWASSADATIVRWNLKPVEPAFAEQLPKGVQGFTTFVDPSDDALSATTSDGQVLRWRLSDGKLEDRLRVATPGAAVDMATFDADGGQVLTAVAGVVHVWDLRARRETASWTASSSAAPLTFQEVAASGNRVATTSTAEIRVWDWSSKTLLHGFPLPGDGVLGFGILNRAGDRLLGTGLGLGEIWSTTTGKSEVHYPTERALHFGIFSPDEKHVLFGGTESAAHVWRSDAPVLEASLEGHGIDVGFAAFLDDEIAITGTYDGTIRVWQWRSGKLVSKLVAHHAAINWGMAGSGYLASADSGGKIVAWKLPLFRGGALELSDEARRHGAFVLRNGSLVSGTAPIVNQ